MLGTISQNAVWFSWSLLTISTFSFLSTACVVASLCNAGTPFIDMGVSSYFWPIIAVFTRVAMTTLPFHFCHHLVGYLIPWPPVCPVAVDKI